ncbi:lycopene beta-cyclase CrtY [Brevundimonas sp. S30B]|uniref:lycopene beta-cyclase CrtY n=1 Tax=unclassified Brevundimonas TaxID=2622653 RepID=UPI001072E935|nr:MULTISPECIES: lycopene beta-cyclase CrtY [unclassified Brevundimonas]QBX37812.1 lycopene beta-cyclase CrtY [Brevundimonas sp. MF30-B]TFW02832.1 lycopene beta-cyclase CrtY [Brevundimonas sp. S30B]
MHSDGPQTTTPDLLLIGGGLANGLLAWRLSQLRPDLDVHIVEAGDRLGGVHTWSFFEQDLTPSQRDWIAPLITHRWPEYSVRFPALRRRLSTGYCSVTSDRFAGVVSAALPGRVTLCAQAIEVSPSHAVLADRRVLRARAVIDGRGPAATPDLALGFQKFVGLEVRLAAPHGLDAPIIMDACVDQAGGYRFLYTLPFEERTLLIEDTRYTDGAELDRDVFRQGVLDYAAQQGWMIEAILREEDGVLPVALDGDIAAHLKRFGPVALSGLRAGLFHPTTGYSLPDAVRLADHLAQELRVDDVADDIRRRACDVWAERGFYRLLNRMLFRAARPEERYRVLERFYRLPQPLIERFYAAESTLGDKARILSGKPPVPLGAALNCLIEKGRA